MSMLKKRLATGSEVAAIPMRVVGPLKIEGQGFSEDISVPLATFESPLWPSVDRGARVSQKSGGIKTTVFKSSMTRSITLDAASAREAVGIVSQVALIFPELEKVVSQTSRYAKLTDLTSEVVGRTLYFRVVIDSADAAGHNMVTKAAEGILNDLLTRYPELTYISLSGNLCTDKKVSAVNSLLGRGRHTIAEITINRNICKKLLQTTPEQIVEINSKKNLQGSILAGSLRSANAHYANILLAAYLATGQDAANIVEGSQGITTAELIDDHLYFSVNLPNIIVGTVGNGKGIAFVENNLAELGCLAERGSGENSNRLAQIIAAAVLCSELSLLAALTNPGELIKTHEMLER